MRLTAKGITYHGYLHHGTASGQATLAPVGTAAQIRTVPASGQPLGGGHARVIPSGPEVAPEAPAH
jgi:hypothetical protein